MPYHEAMIANLTRVARREWSIFQCANGVHMTCPHAHLHLEPTHE